MKTNHTNYPERYRRQERSPMFFAYAQRTPTLIGRDLGPVAGVDGVIVAAVLGIGEGSMYWLDPDCVLMDAAEGSVKHFIWLCDAWQAFEVSHFRPRECRTEADIAESFDRQPAAIFMVAL
jgi:hypothetical protein